MTNRPRPATSTQPQIDSTLGIYSSKKLSTIKVKMKGTDRELIVNKQDFDPERHVRLD